ncbi:MAG: hypothetical protein QW726_04805, partial [Fervidicoccaceae archaeon]
IVPLFEYVRYGNELYDKDGIQIAFLSSMLSPILWGITLVMVIVILARSLSKHFKCSAPQ